MSDINTIRKFFSLVKRNEVTEVRICAYMNNRKEWYHGYYNDYEKLARDVQEFGWDCYFSINRFKPHIKADNKITRCLYRQGAKAEDFDRRTLLYLDLDPNRPSGTPSTDKQLQEAIDLGLKIITELPFPAPVSFVSGNGFSAMWAIDLPPDSPLVKRVLEKIKELYETPTVSVDTSVASLARIGRIPGTDNNKGDKSIREAKILSAPDKLELLTQEVMEDFAPPSKYVEQKRAQAILTGWTFGKTYDEQVSNVDTLLKTKETEYTKHKNGRDETVFEIPCPYRPDQHDGGACIIVNRTTGVYGMCHHRKCEGRTLVDLLLVIAPELCKQATEGYDDSHRIARGYSQSRPPMDYWQGIPYSYNHETGIYEEDSKESIQAGLNLYTKTEFDSLGFKKSPNVTNSLINNVYSALIAQNFDREETAPHWLRNPKYPANEYIQFKNGRLHVPSHFARKSDRFTAPDPDFFCLNYSPYNFDPNAPTPENFIKYCEWQWDDPNEHFLLQEILGDILIPDMWLRVFYGFFGKPGAGKSTLVKAPIEGLVGKSNTCAVDLADFSGEFGLQETIGKKLILISESTKEIHNSSSIAEKIKRITGNDQVNIKRKFKPPWSGRLNAKILAVSNHLLKLLDDSGALFDRLIPLQFTKRIEKPIPGFADILEKELPGILLLALEGWKRLHDNGHFTLPDSSKYLLNELRETGSPVLTFIEKDCLFSKDAFTSTEKLFEKWKEYCIDHELAIGNKEDFISAIKSAAPELKRARQFVDGKKLRGFVGISIKD